MFRLWLDLDDVVGEFKESILVVSMRSHVRCLGKYREAQADRGGKARSWMAVTAAVAVALIQGRIFVPGRPVRPWHA